ncbi:MULTISPECIES: pyruvate dehydrogenase complex dihydrolipoamide acetyltransferase [unclassified Ruegeria]|uniref:pyruvate dehydrogenase complex dihydrolipoamide acetyltransferase n=1 Tax=unclassified Ruegeria TaxID=2625375 RepID=UPI0014898BB7|nr:MULTISPECIES: pyruvate dehydrogenase complex dihydrolipoamide acetyltransferase [unclassified Ruegeria]NOD77317.1 pyruvate dehydrogenase complex dihydrolipoamide acetyltransferase [Ruegeria sp. HKCCD4332]NOD87740.1 pyruvate dehydrogenase complex dihydrolipoamide acetyltransferase [Ruegeria sp. HKCCD4318]NOE14110.1 pyruvate dehydrogenase complex dihydrolipoamide acetyltransferase [Ruegeria sp. HKCCD4318-2]NOG08533.1 pyruvate dehydrogenase complex dihydrolipoamide acetyltransferase [Ruegeria s
MPTEILMPALSPTMEEGTLAKWLVKEGDTVSSGDLLAEIETDKATMEFEAVDEGTIGKILIAEGTEGVKVNTAIAVLLEDGESADDIGATPAAAPAAAPAAETAAPAASETPASAPAPAAPVKADGGRVFASPLARRIAAQKGLDLSQIAGSGPHGRIVKADVESATAAPAAAAPAPATAAPSAPAAPTGPSADMVARMYEGREYEEIQLDGMRKTIAARLSEAKQTIPHFYLRRDIKLDALLKFRSQLNKQLEGRGVKLSVNDFIIKAVANALQQVPACNAVWAGDRVLQLKPSDVAVAVAIEGGLFTPVLQDADTKSLSALSTEMKDLAARARERKLAPHEYQGGTFAVSNLGMFGIDNFDAIVNPPHAGILAVGTGVKKPVVGDDGELTVATVMSVTMSVDHRVIDGALGAELLKAIVDNLENPMVMLA